MLREAGRMLRRNPLLQRAREGEGGGAGRATLIFSTIVDLWCPRCLHGV